MKKQNTLISILIINYNNTKFLERSINSCLNQSYKNIEILVYDDKSTESITKIEKKFQKIKSVKFFKNRNEKTNIPALDASNSYRSLFNRSKGQIICLLDSDDFFKASKVKKIIKIFNLNKKISFIQNINNNDPNVKNSIFSFWPYFAPESCISFKRSFFIKFQKDTNKFNFWTAFKSSGKNTTITRKNILSPFVKRPARYNLGGSYDSKNFSNFAIGAKLNFERGNKNNSWESKGYKKTWAEAAYYFFPKDFLTMRLGFNFRDQKEWLKWIDANNLAAYDATEKFLSFNLNYFKGNKHEIRLKGQFVALNATNPVSLISDENGYLTQSNKVVNSFNLGEAAFQVRYKYELAPLSNLYIVYSQGGSIYEENIDSDSSSIIEDSWNNPSGKIFAIKLRLRF